MSVIISHAEPTPRSGLDLIKALTTGTLMPGGLWQKKSYRLKFALRSCLYLPATLRFMDAMAKNPRFEQLLSVQKTLPGKIHRHYLCLGLSAGERHHSSLRFYPRTCGSAPCRCALRHQSAAAVYACGERENGRH